MPSFLLIRYNPTNIYRASLDQAEFWVLGTQRWIWTWFLCFPTRGTRTTIIIAPVSPLYSAPVTFSKKTSQPTQWVPFLYAVISSVAIFALNRIALNSLYCLSYLLMYAFIYVCFRGREREGEREGEKQSVCKRYIHWLPLTPSQLGEPGPQPRHVPWLGIEPVTFWFSGRRSVHWATPARAKVFSKNF